MMSDLLLEEKEMLKLSELENQLEDMTSDSVLRKYYKVALDSFSIMEATLTSMLKDGAVDRAIQLLIDNEISDRLRCISMWLEAAEESITNGRLAFWSQSDTFNNLNQDLSKAMDRVLKLTQCERSDNFVILREQLFKVEDRIDTYNMMNFYSPSGDIIKIDRNGSVIEKPSRLKTVQLRSWKTEERMERLPTTEKLKFQMFESDVFIFEQGSGKNRLPYEVTKATNVDLVFQVEVDRTLDSSDISLFAKVMSKDQPWITVKCQFQDGYAVFRAEKVTSFCIVRAPKETEILVGPRGGQYVHKADRRINIDFPEESVGENQVLKVTVLPVHKKEMKIRREMFPNQYKFLALTKGIHVEGNIQKSVNVKLPMETFESEDTTGDDVELLYIHIDEEEEVQIVRDKPIKLDGDTINTAVESFSMVAIAKARRGSNDSGSKMEARIGLGLLYHCQFLTFVRKVKETYVEVWCEVVKKEDANKKESERLENIEHLTKIKLPPKDIFIREEERIRVDFRGNAVVNKKDIPLSHLLITFIPIAENNSIFIPLVKNIMSGGSPYTAVTFTGDRFNKTALCAMSFDPWSLRNTRYKTPQNFGSRFTLNTSFPSSQNVTRSNSKASIRSDTSENSSDFVSDDVSVSSSATAAQQDQMEFDKFFSDYKLQKIQGKFIEQGFDCVDALMKVTESDMKELQLDMGSRKKFLAAKEKYSQTMK